MQTNDKGWISSLASAADTIDFAALADLALLGLAGLSIAAAVAIFVGSFIIAPIGLVSRSLRTSTVWIRQADWKPLRSLLLVVAMLCAIGAMTFLGAKAVYQANPVAEILLIILTGLILIFGGALILWRLANKAKQSATTMIRDQQHQSIRTGG